ncbi:Metallo-beta-lactamase family protein [uncultured Desulfatiglans sp.]|nr:Metallo-beta-lactamase family protein [uncultured Desulfatiglans sp.]
MQITFWGTRGSIAAPGRDTVVFGGNTCCVEVTTAGGRTIVIDAGSGIRPLGETLASREGAHEILLLMTHNHWDHVQGFPFFKPAYLKDWTIRVDGFHSCMKGLRAIFDNRMGDGFFPIAFEELKADIHFIDRMGKGPLEWDDVVIDAMPLQHPQGGVGFRFREDGRSFVFLTDNELREDAWAGRKPSDYVRFCGEAELLVHDAQYTPAEHAERCGWGHSDHAAVVDLAIEAGAKRLLFFHHDPGRTDAELSAILDDSRRLLRDRRAGTEIDAAREGAHVRVGA